MSTDRGSPEFEDLIAEAIRSAMLSVNVALPGVVVTYDAATKTAKVQPLVKRPIETSEGRLRYESWPPIQNVPVMFRGGASFSEHFPLAAGDAVDLIFQDFSFAGWRQSGKESEAHDTHNHGPSYPIAVPWYRPDGGPGEDTDDPSLGRPGGLRVYLGTTSVDVGKGAGLVAVALATLVATELGKIATTLGTGSNGAGAVVFGTPYVPASVASVNLKAK